MKRFGDRRLKSWLSAVGIVSIFVFSLSLALLPRASHASADFNNTIGVEYNVHADGVTHVTETYDITNETTNKYLDSIQLATPTDEANNLSVTYSDGATIPHTTTLKSTTNQGYNYDYQQINIQFDRQNSGRGARWSFEISYDTTKLVESKGGAHTVYIPSIAENSSDHYNVSLLVPTDFGGLHTSGQRPTSDGVKNGRAKYSFSNLDLTQRSLALVFGDYTIYDVNFNFPLNNDSAVPKNFTVTLPPTTENQKIYITGLNPQPQATRLDGDGNILADYTVPAHTHWVVTTDISAVVRYLEYDLGASGTKADIPSGLVGQYTSPSQYWQATNPALVQKAHEIVQGKRTVADQVRAVNDFVINALSYNSDKIKYNVRQGALKALLNPNNVVCLEYSDLTIALLRANGIPARMPIGYGYSGNLKQSNSVTDSLHSWVEAYVPGIGWMNVDPTWGEKFQNFGQSDLDHFAFAIWGQADAAPAAITENGEDTNYQYENTTIHYQQNMPHIAINTQLSATKYALLPFVSLVSYRVQAPQSTAGDNYYLEISEGNRLQRVGLGSLAPAQKVSSLALEFGIGFWQHANVRFVQSGSNSLILGNTTIATHTWPLIVLALIAGVLLLLVIKSKVTKHKHRKALEQAKATVSKPDSQTSPTPPKDHEKT